MDLVLLLARLAPVDGNQMKWIIIVDFNQAVRTKLKMTHYT